MNMITTDKFAQGAQGTELEPQASATDTNPVLTRLMKAWESKNARAAKRLSGFTLVAVTLAACDDDDSSSASGSDGDNGGDDGGDDGTTPIPEGGNFQVLDFPETVESGLFFQTAGGGLAPVGDMIALLTGALEAINSGAAEVEGVTAEDIQVVIDGIEQSGSNDGDVVVNVGSSGGADDFATLLNSLVSVGILGGIEQVDVTTVGRVILTPEFNSGEIITQGIVPGPDGELNQGTPGAGDDTIFMGRTELLHGAIIDAGAGIDTLKIVTKGPYAQPAAVWNVETVDILHLPNLSLSSLPSGVNTNVIINGAQTNTAFLLQDSSVLDHYTSDEDTWLDLGAVMDITTLKIAQNGGDHGDLYVVGVNNGATLHLTGQFNDDVIVDYGFGGGSAVTVVLNNVNFDDDELVVAQNSTAIILDSTGGPGAVENFINDGDFGPNLRDLTITGDVFLHIDDEVDFNEGRAITIDAGANTGGVKLEAENDSGDSIANNTINLVGSQGDDHFKLEADAFDITSGAGSNTYDLTGSYNGPLVNGMLLNFEGAVGADTIILNDDGYYEYSNSFGSSFDFNTMLSGSSISGADNTLVVNTNYSLTEASVDGVVSVQMAPGIALALTPAQVSALGAGVFSDIDGDENVASLPSNPFGPQSTPVLAIVMDSDASLSDLIDVSALDSGVKLGFRIPEGVTLTLTAEELHNFVASPGILMGNDDTNPLESVGNLVITDAGQNFDAFNSTAVDVPGQGLFPGGGTVIGSTNNVTIERSDDGFDRPSQEFLDDTLLIDSSDGPVDVGPNDFGNDDEFTIPQTDTLIMSGANDITFTAPVSFAGQTGFTIDFSEVGGVVTGLEIVDFHNITPGGNTDNWGEIIGNGDARIDVQLDGNVGNANNGLISSGVATYVVTELAGNPGTHQFWTSDPTEDLEVLGLQGNGGDTITFGNVRNGVNFLLEGDGFASFEDVPKALEPLDESNIGTLNALFAPGSGTVTANVEINNQGVELGAASDGGEREFYVDGININGAQTIAVTVFDGDADIGGTAVGTAGISGDVLETIVITSADDVTLTLDSGSSSLEAIDAGGVDGTMTLQVLEFQTVDLSGTTLTGIDAIQLDDSSDLTLTVEQALDIGIGNISVDGNTANLTLNVTEDFNINDLDVANLPDGLSLELSLQSEVELNITGDQLLALEDAGVAITDGSGSGDLGTVNITDVNQTHMINGSGVIPVPLAGTVTLEGPIEIYVPSGAPSNFFDDFAWELEGGTLGLTQQSMADGLVVNNGDVQFFFIPSTSSNSTGDPINASGYTNIGTLSVNEFGLPSTYNIESITFLDSDTEVEIVPLVPVEFDGVDRTLIVGGVPFAINDDGIPFNPATGDAGPVTTGDNLLFSNISGDSNRNVENVTISFEEGGNIIGDIVIGKGALPDGNLFETLTLISNGDDVNTVNNIESSTGDNNLLDVNIVANQEFSAQTITLSATEAGSDATVTITGSADVTIKGIDATDPEIATLTIDTLGHSGTYTVTGGSPSIDAGETLVFDGGVDSTVNLDTADGPGVVGNLGVDGNGVLELLDASGMEGTLALGDVSNVDVTDGFTLIGGTGVITAEMVFSGFPAFDWSFDISDAASGSAIDFNIGGTVLFTLTGGSITLVEDPDSGETTLTVGDGTTLVLEADIDLSSFADNLEFGQDVTVVLGEDGLVRLSDEDFEAFVTAGGSVEGDTEKTFDNSSAEDLTDIRGLEQIDLVENTGPYTLDSEQVGIARPVDADGNPLGDNGDIAALKDAGVLGAIDVDAGNELSLTDNEADGLDITGDGAVNVTIEGAPGAVLDVTPGADNDPGQSITVNYTLNGTAGSVAVDNTTTDFQLQGQTATAVATALGAVAGITASASGSEVTASAESGDSFVIDSIDVVDNGSGLEVDAESFISSDADMSGNTVVNTTHSFPEINGGDFKLDANFEFGGAADGDGNVTITLDAPAGNFIDAAGIQDSDIPTFVSPGNVEFVLVGGPKLKLDNGFLDGKAVSGDGSVQVENPLGSDFSVVDVPVEVVLLGVNVIFSGSFNGDQPVTVVDTDETTEFEFDITGATGLPSSFILDGTTLKLTVVQADGLTITGGSTAIVTMDGNDPDQEDNNAVLSNIDTDDVDLVIEVVNGPVEFGGELPGGEITIEGGLLELKPGVSFGTGISFSVAAGATLQLTGALADGLTIEGDGNVILTDVTAGQDLSGLSVTGDVIVQFDDDTETEFTLPASAISGSTVTVENVGGSIDTLTVTGVEDSDADFDELSVTADGGAGDVVLELDSTGDHELGEFADFGITNPGDVTLAISGTGSVTVDTSADLTGITAYTVDDGSTLVSDASEIGNDDFVDPSLVSGLGKLDFTDLDGLSVTANDEVRTNEFVFDSADTGTTITDFEAGVGNDGFFIFDGSDPLNPVLGTMRLNLSDFETNGSEVITVQEVSDLNTNTDISNVGLIIIEDAVPSGNLNGIDFGTDGEEAELFFAFNATGGSSDDTEIVYWDDISDGEVNSNFIGTELTNVATLSNTESEDLGSANFVI